MGGLNKKRCKKITKKVLVFFRKKRTAKVKKYFYN